MFSNTAITVERAAKDIKRKKSVPNILPGIAPMELNTLGRERNTSPGPDEGSTPNAEHAGKIISPEKIATNVSSPITRRDSPVSE